MSEQEIKALLERTAELLMFVDYELSRWQEDLAWRELARKYEQEQRELVVQPVLRLPAKAR